MGSQKRVDLFMIFEVFKSWIRSHKGSHIDQWIMGFWKILYNFQTKMNESLRKNAYETYPKWTPSFGLTAGHPFFHQHPMTLKRKERHSPLSSTWKNTHHRVESFWFMIPSDLQRMVAEIFSFVRFPPAKTWLSTCSLLECGVHHTSIVLNLNMTVEITWGTKAPTEGGSSESFVSSIFSHIFYTHISKNIFHLISHMYIYIYYIHAFYR